MDNNRELQATEEWTEVLIDGNILKIYNSLKNERLPEETFEEYKVRRKAIKNYMKSKEKGAFIHKSANLIPKMGIQFNEETKKLEDAIVTDNKGNPEWIGKTRGVTYIKHNKKKEHLELVETLKNIADGK